MRVVMKSILPFFLVFIFLSCNSEEKWRLAKEKAISDSIARVEREKQRLLELEHERQQDSIAKVEHENLIKNSLKITRYYLSSPNSAAGVDAYFYYQNLSDKVIKYLSWEGYPINAVGDAVACEVRHKKNFSGQHTGPVKRGQKGGGCWGCAWYNWTAKKLIITKVKIEYMDGTFLIIDSPDLHLIGINNPENVE